jgi:hypothetical protein
MAGSPEDICLFACSPQSPGDTWRPRSYPEQSGRPIRGDTWQPQSCPEPGAGARAMGTRGGPGATPSREREPEPWGHVAASELPSLGRREPLS